MMKKRIALLSVFVLLCSSMLFLFQNIVTPSVTAKVFSDAVTEMNESYRQYPLHYRLIVESKWRINPLDSISCAEGNGNLHILQFDNESSADAALEYYRNADGIIAVEQDEAVYTCEDDEDIYDFAEPDYEEPAYYDGHLSWGSSYIGVDDYADVLNALESMPQVTVGIIDSGVCYDHDFLKNRVVRTHYNTSHSEAEQGGEYDDYGHGTLVAGIIADNTLPNTKIRAYKVIDQNGSGSKSLTVAAIYQAIEDNVDIINLSVAGPKTGVYQSPIKSAVRQGIVVCVAAGNKHQEITNVEPACVAEALTVSALDKYHQLASFTNYGEGVDLIAPGVLINSTYLDNSYATRSGTSFASPFAVAAAALVKTAHPQYNVAQIEAFLKNNGRDSTYDSVPNAKILNFYNVTDNPEQQEPTEPSSSESESHSESQTESTEPSSTEPSSEPGSEPETQPTTELTTHNHSDYINNSSYKPVFNYDSGDYDDYIELEISTNCDENTVIYYTLYDVDRTELFQEEMPYYGIPGELPLFNSCCVVATAYGENYKGTSVAYYHIAEEENNYYFDIDAEGTITAYHGLDAAEIEVPAEVDGITVTAIGSDAFYGSNREQLKRLTLPDTCTEIKEGAFENAVSLQVIFAKGLKTIGDRAFKKTTSLSYFDFTNIESVGQEAFYNSAVDSVYSEKLTTIGTDAFAYSHLEYILIPNITMIDSCSFRFAKLLKSVEFPRLTSLNSYVFCECEQLNEVLLPAVTSLNTSGHQFYNCKTLEGVTFGASLTQIPTYCFSYTNIPILTDSDIVTVGKGAYQGAALHSVTLENCTTVADNAFNDCKQLLSVSLPSMNTLTGNYAFSGCDRLASVSLPALTKISGYNAFSYCTALESVAIPLLATAYDYAFFECSALKNVSLPSLTTLGRYDFARCFSLTSIALPALKTISMNGFESCTALESVDFPALSNVASSAFKNCTSLVNISFPLITSIPNSIFYNCTSLTSVDCPRVTSIGKNAFLLCTALPSVSFPSVAEVSEFAFGNCTALSEVSLPNLQTAGQRAFNNCSSLQQIVLPKLTRVGTGLFCGCTSLKRIYLPSATTMANFFYNSPIDLLFVPELSYIHADNLFSQLPEGGNNGVTVYLNKMASTVYSEATAEDSAWRDYPILLNAPSTQNAYTAGDICGWDIVDTSTMVTLVGIRQSNGTLYLTFMAENPDDLEEIVPLSDAREEFELRFSFGSDLSIYRLTQAYQTELDTATGCRTFTFQFVPSSYNADLQPTDRMSVRATYQRDNMMFTTDDISGTVGDFMQGNIPTHTHQFSVASFNAENNRVTLCCNSDEVSRIVLFKNYLSTEAAATSGLAPALDINHDGIINAKDYARLVQEYDN